MNNTAKSFTIVTGFSIATRLMSFVFKMWMSRTLGAEVVGQYQIALSVLLMLFTITAGAPVVLSRKVAEASVNGDIKKQNSLTTASIILGLSSSAVICAVLFALGDRLSLLFSNPECLPIFFIMLPSLVTSTLYMTLRSWFWGRKNFVAFSSTELIDEVVRIILAIVFASGIVTSMRGANGIALAMTLSDALCVIILAVLYFIAGGRLSKPSGFKDLTLGTIPLSATRIISSLGASLTALVIPQLLVSSGMSMAEATAEYGRVAGMALPLIMAPVTFISALSVVLTPDIAQLRKQNDMEALRTKLSTSLLFALIIASFFFAVYLPLGQSLGKLLFADKKAGDFVSYCSLILFPIATAQATTPMFNSLGKERYTLLFTILGAVSMLPCIFFLPKLIGVYSMAVASGLCFAIISICNFVVLKKEVGAFINHKKTIPLILSSILLAVSGYFSARLLRSYAGHITTIIVTGVYLVFFFFIIIGVFDIADIVACIKMLKPSAKTSNIRHNDSKQSSDAAKTRKFGTKTAYRATHSHSKPTHEKKSESTSKIIKKSAEKRPETRKNRASHRAQSKVA